MFADSRLVSWARSALQWSLPIKLAVGAIVGLIGGGFLGYNAEYATYNYAIQYGVRAPIEGIPYLKAAVTFGSFFLLLTGSLVFFCCLACAENSSNSTHPAGHFHFPGIPPEYS